MLVRDPADCVISHMNDVNDGHSRSIESLLTSQMSRNQLFNVRLSMFGKIIQNVTVFYQDTKYYLCETENIDFCVLEEPVGRNV